MTYYAGAAKLTLPATSTLQGRDGGVVEEEGGSGLGCTMMGMRVATTGPGVAVPSSTRPSTTLNAGSRVFTCVDEPGTIPSNKHCLIFRRCCPYQSYQKSQTTSITVMVTPLGAIPRTPLISTVHHLLLTDGATIILFTFNSTSAVPCKRYRTEAIQRQCPSNLIGSEATQRHCP